VRFTRIVAVAAPLSVVLAVTGGATSQAAEPSTKAAFVQQKAVTFERKTPTWTECYPGRGYPQLRCASVRVPLDWAAPNGQKITIAVSRVKASNPAARRGVLFTNPGGPGAPGLALSLFLALAEPKVAAAYDIIGLDPRGVGSSSPVLECAPPSILGELYNLDGRDVSAANQRRFEVLDERFARTCSSAALTRYLTTDQIAHDLDLVRAVLGERKISYVGFSAGTWLGARYAALFPQRVDRFLLDGNLDFTSPSYSSAARQPRGFQRSFEDSLLPWIAEHDQVYGLGSTPARVKQIYESRRAALVRTPLV
jgi:pimeloyl-ACP methyl ester carboxylesterase